MSREDEARITGLIECQFVVERELTRAELNIRRVIGITVISTLIGSIAGIFFPMNHQPNARNMKTVETIAKLEELAKEYPKNSDEYRVLVHSIEQFKTLSQKTEAE